MTARERVNLAIHHQWPDRAPKEAGFTPAIMERYRQEVGGVSPADHFGIEIRHAGFKPSSTPPDFSRYFEDIDDDTLTISEYGTAGVRGSMHHFTRRVFPLRNADSVSDVEEYPWPDFTPPERHQHLEQSVAALHEQGYFVDGFVGHIFETAWQIIGFERMFEDFIMNPDFVAAVLDHITTDNCFKARRLAEAGVDMIRCGDDVGMQDRLMMRPDVWREWLKPRLAAEIAAAREVQPEIPVWYHSDGKITDIIDDLIEVGVTILNPVQPECMDVVELKRRYGSRLAFWGTIGTQTVMPFGTADDVRRTVRDMIELFKPSIVLAPTHVLEPDVPWENIIAFFDAIEEYGRYS